VCHDHDERGEERQGIELHKIYLGQMKNKTQKGTNFKRSSQKEKKRRKEEKKERERKRKKEDLSFTFVLVVCVV